jgi:hypothetical protein
MDGYNNNRYQRKKKTLLGGNHFASKVKTISAGKPGRYCK